MLYDFSFQELTEALENARNNNLSQNSNRCPRSSNIFHLQQVRKLSFWCKATVLCGDSLRVLRIHLLFCNILQKHGQNDETCSTKSCDVTMTTAAAALAAVTSSKQQQHLHRRPLLRAHSCGSLMGLKEKALLARLD